MKLRVRTLESERAFQRVAVVQNMVGSVSFRYIKWGPDISFIYFVLAEKQIYCIYSFGIVLSIN